MIAAWPGVARELARWLRRAGLILFVLAAIGQIGSGALLSGLALPTGERGGSNYETVLGVICHTGSPAAGEPARQHHGNDCALCPFCLSLGASFTGLAPAPDVSLPNSSAQVLDGTWSPVRAPPSRGQQTAYPRGPPALV